ncbi:MAG: SdpI family protein, partial [Oscillospiraceae bacterium]|nr:SdpI family protein [Oscillospiraceae bacterium]
RWFLLPFYCLLAALPLVAAFWVYQGLSPWFEVTPGVFVPSGRGGVWLLPAVNVCLAAALYILTHKMGKAAAEKAKREGFETDILQLLPGIRLFLMAFLSATCLSAVYGYYALDAGQLTGELIGRVSAFIPGIGVSLFALRLPRATKKNVLALRFSYTLRSTQVWPKVHKLGAWTLYIAGAIMVGTAFLLSGLQAVMAAAFALGAVLFALYLYAKHLYEDEFRP